MASSLKEAGRRYLRLTIEIGLEYGSPLDRFGSPSTLSHKSSISVFENKTQISESSSLRYHPPGTARSPRRVGKLDPDPRLMHRKRSEKQDPKQQDSNFFWESETQTEPPDLPLPHIRQCLR
jgi:hypothetical protein